MADKPLDRILDLFLKRYLARNPDQLRPIEALTASPRRFLVVSSTAVGDTILSTPAIKSLRRSFPEAHITALFHKRVAPLFAAFPYVDDVVTYAGGYKHFWRTVQRLRQIRPEAALILHGNGPQDIPLAVFSGARFILKHPTETEYKKYLSGRLEKRLQHVIEERLDLVRKVGGREVDTNLELPWVPGPELRKKVSGLLSPEKTWIGFQIGAANVYKMWPIERFTALAERILGSDPDAAIAITGNQKEKKLADRVAERFPDRVVNACGQFAIQEWPGLIRYLKLLVTNDTGTLHLAVALKTPTLSLFSATDSRLIGPYQDPGFHRVIQKEGGFVQRLPKEQRTDEAMRLITVDEVFAAYEHIVSDRSV
ncbi:MAG: glycosyltransferase family 9 protein [Deltaproteobacteria bacterium]|nr:glycosyltransferase family 9 protein [Deltaproteobacteria bacterium]